MDWRSFGIGVAIGLLGWWGLSYLLSPLWSGLGAVIVALSVPLAQRFYAETKRVAVPKVRRALQAELTAIVRRADAPLPQRIDALRRLVRELGAKLVPLIDELFAEDDDLRPEAVRAYGRLKHVDAIEKIASVIEDSDERLGKAAAIALGAFKTPEAEGALGRCLAHPARAVVWEAVESLRRVGREAALGFLTALADETGDDDELRRHIKRALAAVRRRVPGAGRLSLVPRAVGGLSMARGRPESAETREPIKWFSTGLFGTTEAVFTLGGQASGIFVIGIHANGVVAIGVYAVGVIAIGPISLGILAAGLVAPFSPIFGVFGRFLDNPQQFQASFPTIPYQIMVATLLVAELLVLFFHLRPNLVDAEGRMVRMRLRAQAGSAVLAIALLTVTLLLIFVGIDLGQFWRF